MSRSYKKFAKTDEHSMNGEFYRERNKSTRHQNKANLRNLFANKQIDDIADELYTIKNKHNKNYDSWKAPVDWETNIWDNAEEKYFRK